MTDEITFHECCRIILEQAPSACQSKHTDNPHYRQDLLAVLNKEFGIEWSDTETPQDSFVVRDAQGSHWNEGTPAIAASLLRHYRRISDPFSEYFEYTFAKGEIEVWKTHQADIGDAATAMKRHLVALFRDLLLLRWPDAAYRTTSWARLRALGLVGEAYDPDDFF